MADPILPPLDHQQMRHSIEQAVSWLKNAQEPNGHFQYEYLPYKNVYCQDDNIVRQAGALYALGEVAKRDVQDKYHLEPYIRRSIAYFESLSPQVVYDDQRFRAVCTDSVKGICRVGATSLVLCSILAAAERYPELAVVYDDLIRDYVAFIVAMKQPDAGFANTFKLHAKAQDTKESSYGNGEALLALTRYHRYAEARGILGSNDQSSRLSKEMFVYITSSAVPFDRALYLWAMAALNDLTTYDIDQTTAHVDYARRFTLWRIESVSDLKNSRHNLSSAVEGMTSAYNLLQSALTAEELQPFGDEIDFWLAHTARMQLTASGPQAHRIRNASRSHGGFLTGLHQPSQRIDFTQHALMSLLQKLYDIDGQPL